MNVTNMPVLKKLMICGFWSTFFSGHISFWKFCFYGQNAMYWSVDIYGTKWGTLHIDLPTLSRVIGRRNWCMYASPNGTPWACTWYVGNKDSGEGIRARVRKLALGHNFKVNTQKIYDRLMLLNEKIDDALYA